MKILVNRTYSVVFAALISMLLLSSCNEDEVLPFNASIRYEDKSIDQSSRIIVPDVSRVDIVSAVQSSPSEILVTVEARIRRRDNHLGWQFVDIFLRDIDGFKSVNWRRFDLVNTQPGDLDQDLFITKTFRLSCLTTFDVNCKMTGVLTATLWSPRNGPISTYRESRDTHFINLESNPQIFQQCTTELNDVIVTPASSDRSFDGKIEIIATRGNGLVRYSINYSALQSSSIFDEVPFGQYFILIQDDFGCTRKLNVIVGVKNLYPSQVILIK